MSVKKIQIANFTLLYDMIILFDPVYIYFFHGFHIYVFYHFILYKLWSGQLSNTTGRWQNLQENCRFILVDAVVIRLILCLCQALIAVPLPNTH